MLYRRTILSKILSNGLKADFALISDEGEFKAALYVNGRFIPGPALPEKLDPPSDDLTHWMGNKPGVGLSTEEAEKIINAVTIENSVVKHRREL
ncbi:hypothetical protein [Geobacter sp. AOG2]|uniref:hypothetical protein n=1 Tax=Geobacter sp. AOG2 TaxID=1566347 RepID=UPI001CC59AFD|nr:hypothetical protein [Geobacter sp. AOG2]GFE62638.1 hypothetical protein AOG2_32260 [Geobacter sp. AOG2]